MSSNVNQRIVNQRNENPEEDKGDRYHIGNLFFQSELSFYLINCIEKNLTPLYKSNKANKTKFNPITEKNLKFRLNKTNYATILMRLDYLIFLLEEHADKLNKHFIKSGERVLNKIRIQCSKYDFIEMFPNITNLFYELFVLNKTIPGIEEEELDEEPNISLEDICLHDFAQRLSKLGLRMIDDSKNIYNVYNIGFSPPDHDSDDDIWGYEDIDYDEY